MLCCAVLCCACSRSELAEFGEPDFVIYNGGCFPANKVGMFGVSFALLMLYQHRHQLEAPTSHPTCSACPPTVHFVYCCLPLLQYNNFMTSSTSIDISLKHREMVILGTQYAGEMKKGVFT
jgi:phosphoenolpyruvate carboxykinase (ATP)